MTSGARRRSSPPAFLVAGYTLLLLAWVFGNAPFASPDESAHYVRAIGIANGDLVADPGRYEGSTSLTEQQVTWINRFTGSVTVPAGLAPVTGPPCYVTDPTNSAACHPLIGSRVERRVLTYVATYLPGPYLLPALALEPAETPKTALWLARLASALVVAGFITLAVILVWARGDGLSLVGVVIALTPMTVFLGASINPNALEVAAATAFAAALLRLTRNEPISSWVWVAAAAAGAALVLSRPTGPLWLLLVGAAALSAGGVGRLWRAAASMSRPAIASGSGVVGALTVTALWELRVGAGIPASTRDLATKVEYGLYQVPELLAEQIGVFGYRTVEMPYGAYGAWWALVIGVGAFALIVANGPERSALLGAAAAGLLVPVALYALFFADSGFSNQGRYFLGLAVVVPLLAGEVVHRNRSRLAATNVDAVPVVVAAVAAVVHLVAWYWNAKQYAVGTAGPLWFPAVAVWGPPGSWWLWLGVAVAACSLIAYAGVLTVRCDRERAFPD